MDGRHFEPLDMRAVIAESCDVGVHMDSREALDGITLERHVPE